MPNLLCAFQAEIAEGLPGLRATCARSAMGGEPPLVMQASLGYLTAMVRSQRVPKGVFGEGVFHRAPQGRRNLAKTGGAKPLGGPSWKTPSPKKPFGTLQQVLGKVRPACGSRRPPGAASGGFLCAAPGPAK